MQFFCLKRYAYYLPRWVRHQFTDDFSISIPPLADITSGRMTRAVAWTAAAFAEAARSRFTIREVTQEEYQDWFELVGKSYLFLEDLWAEQSKMWYAEDWTQSFEVRLRDWLKQMRSVERGVDSDFSRAATPGLLSTRSLAGSSLLTSAWRTSRMSRLRRGSVVWV